MTCHLILHTVCCLYNCICPAVVAKLQLFYQTCIVTMKKFYFLQIIFFPLDMD
jgi:hypothetical protein